MILKLPERLPQGFDRLTVRAFPDITDAQFRAIKDQAVLTGDHAHSALKRTFTIDNEPCGFFGLIGVHDVRKEDSAKDLSETGFFLHYSFSLEAGIEYEDEPDESWDGLNLAVAHALKTHPADASLSLYFDLEEIVPATSLPIPLGESGVSGFSEIRGVRLAQANPSDEAQELYAVVIDRQEHRYWVSATTSIESVFDDALMIRSLERLNDVAAFAYKKT